ncbi:pantoate--beta-alanine ligase [Candidatus Termititenax persephonae]|uniref:Pantothenate synthetase n=1 Tax=Candidatus Termititenax persephonae TaxID=2218525 RepID=A0A388THH6_9BACT|nr:pantoate--beta-alanine ligase [Candidatus Termititenax persephonae]
MLILKTVAELAPALAEFKKAGQSSGFVPTMGCLHAGHLSLVKQAKAVCDRVVVSIFVNPRQFGPHEDFAQYPRDLAQDAELLSAARVDILFAPETDDIYPPDKPVRQVRADERLTEAACGLFRPGHFDGVTTVVARLFDVVRPDKAFFGKKDYQQLRIIQKMVAAEKYPVEIIACPLVREPDGLAMSSRNKYLTPEQRQSALALHRSLDTGAELLLQGKSLDEVKLAVWQTLRSAPEVLVNYVEILRRDDLSQLGEYLPGRTVMLLAAYVGTTRLIDNLEL